MEREEPMEFERRSGELEGQAERLEQQSDRVGGRIEEAKRDWEAKKSDSSVPGAVEDDLGVDEEISGEAGEPSESDDSKDAPRSGEQSEGGQ
jgi:hypothetical protein